MNQSDMLQKIDSICSDSCKNRHSYFQLQYFVIGKEPTMQAKIQACKRELLSRKDDIYGLMSCLEDFNDQLRLEELTLEQLINNNKKLDEKEEIFARKVKRKIKNYHIQINDVKSKLSAKEDEANFLIGLYEKLIEVEPEKDWDSLQVQMEYWNAKLTREIESRLLMGTLPNIEDFKTVLALPNGMPIKNETLKLIKNRKDETKKITENSCCEEPKVNNTTAE